MRKTSRTSFAVAKGLELEASRRPQREIPHSLYHLRGAFRPRPHGTSILDCNRLCLSQIKSEYIGNAARPGLEGEEYALPSEPCAIGAHPCPMIGTCASHYSSSCKTAARDEDAARQIQQHGQGIAAESNRSAVQHMRFAMASAATSVDHECPWIELFE